MVLVRIDAEFLLVLATQTLTRSKQRTGVRARGYAEPIILRSPATLGRAAARTVRLFAYAICAEASAMSTLARPGDRQRAGFVEPTHGVTLSTAGLPFADLDMRLAEDDCPPSRVAPN